MTEPRTVPAAPCHCGCGGFPKLPTSRYLPGHHKQRPHPLEGRYDVDPATDCWVWSGYRVQNGYGQLTYRCERWLAHRLSYFLHHGHLPPAPLQLHHVCTNRGCINPDHLEPATPLANRRAAPTKLDPEKAARIRALAPGMPRSALAERFGV